MEVIEKLQSGLDKYENNSGKGGYHDALPLSDAVNLSNEEAEGQHESPLKRKSNSPSLEISKKSKVDAAADGHESKVSVEKPVFYRPL